MVQIHTKLEFLEAASPWRPNWLWEEFFVRRGIPVTKASIILVAQNVVYRFEEILASHLAHGPAIPISQRLFERVMSMNFAANIMSVLMRYLSPAFTVTDDMMHRAISSSSHSVNNIVPLLLAQEPTLRITESLVEVAISLASCRKHFLQSLLSHDPTFKISDHLPTEAVLEGSRRVGDFEPKIVVKQRKSNARMSAGFDAVKSLLGHDPHFRITYDSLEKATEHHELSDEMIDVLWDRLIKDGNADDVIIAGLEHHYSGTNEHGSTAWIHLLLWYNKGDIEVFDEPWGRDWADHEDFVTRILEVAKYCGRGEVEWRGRMSAWIERLTQSTARRREKTVADAALDKDKGEEKLKELGKLVGRFPMRKGLQEEVARSCEPGILEMLLKYGVDV